MTTSLSPAQWAEVKALFGDALDLDPAARAALLETRASDPAVRAEVESLLASHDGAGAFIAAPAVPLVDAPEPPESLDGTTIGPYRIERRIGQGGMGAVYLASRADDAFRKRVALKIIKRGMDSDEIVARFRRERQTLANLDHPSIARLFDGGTTADGRPYFVMEFVEGKPLDEYCRALTLHERLYLFRTVCGAVQFAHTNLVVHRDLKPDNILVTNEGVPKLLDFGIAKLLGADSSDTAETRQASRMLTLDYASPEQVRGDPVSTAADVFSLGVMLYELVAGAHPFRRPGMTARQLEDAICQQDPPRPGQGEIDLIVLKAMRKEPARRYQAAIELDDDLRRYLEGLPITAHADTVGYRVRKFVRRHAAAVGAAALLIAALVAGLVAVSWQARVAEAERDRARIEAAKARQVSDLLEQMLRAADPAVDGRQVTVASLIAEASERARVELVNQPDVHTAVRTAIGNTYYGLGLYPEAVAELEETLGLARATHGTGSLEAATAGMNLAFAQLALGDMDAAQREFDRSLEALGRVAGADPSREGDVRWRALNGLGLIAARRGDSAAAEQRYRAALDEIRRLYGDADIRVAEVTNNLAVQAQERADLDEAERLYREALRITRERQGERLPGYVAGLSNLANVLHSKGDLQDAREVYERALALRVDLLGADHPDVAFTEVNYALLLDEMGEHDAAREMANRVLARRGDSLPDGHPLVAAALVARGQAQLALAAPAAAERDMREALRLRVDMVPPGHWLIANTESMLGECLMAQGRMQEAEPMLERSYRRLLDDRGPAHERTRDARRRLARLYEATNRRELAANLR